MKRSSLIALRGGILAAGLAVFAVHAQTAPPRELTRDELRACTDGDTALARRRKEIEGRSKEVREQFVAIRLEREQLAAEQNRIAREQGPRDSLDRKLRAHNERVQGTQGIADFVNQGQQALNSAVVAHDAQCGRVSSRRLKL
jgi:hypothetical protein